MLIKAVASAQNRSQSSLVVLRVGSHGVCLAELVFRISIGSFRMCHLLLRELLVCAFVRSLKTHNGVEPGHWNQQRRQTDHPWRLCCW